MNSQLPKFTFYIFITIGIISFIILSFKTIQSYYISDLEVFYKLIPGTAILLSSLIASFAVIRTIVHSKEQEVIKSNKEASRNNYIIKAYYNSFLRDISYQISEFKKLKAIVKDNMDNDKLTLKDLKIDEFFYSEHINYSKYSKSMEKLLDHNLYTYHSDDTLEIVISIKNHILEIIHETEIVRKTLVKNNNKNGFISWVDSTIKNINKLSETINKEIKDKLQ